MSVLVITVSPAKMDEPILLPFGCRLTWAQETIIRLGCMLAPPDEYGRSYRIR